MPDFHRRERKSKEDRKILLQFARPRIFASFPHDQAMGVNEANLRDPYLSRDNLVACLINSSQLFFLFRETAR